MVPTQKKKRNIEATRNRLRLVVSVVSLFSVCFYVSVCVFFHVCVNVDDLLRCFICFERVNEPHLCPACSKMGCKSCMTVTLITINTTNITTEQKQEQNNDNDISITIVVSFLFPCQKWLLERRSCCPFCRSSLRVDQLVNCRFMEDIYSEIERIEQRTPTAPAVELCEQHQAAVHYFCQTCQQAICPDCAMVIEFVQLHNQQPTL